MADSAPAHQLTASSPLDSSTFLPYMFTGVEEISQPFRFELQLLADMNKTIDFAKILGKTVTVTLDLPNGVTRYFNGIIARFTQGETVRLSTEGSAFYIRYRAEIAPKFWFLSKNVQSRVFQHLTVPQILTQVLTGITVENKIEGNFLQREYCVQYRESDFDFASRLMEEEGIFYYFTYTQSAHTLVLGNEPSANQTVASTPVSYKSTYGDHGDQPIIMSWEKSQEIRAGKVTLWDHHFQLPTSNLSATKTTPPTVQAGTVSHTLTLGNDSLEDYEYPGYYAKRFDGVNADGADQAEALNKVFDDNDRTAGIRIQQETTSAVTIGGTSLNPSFMPGCKFALQNHPNGDGSYVLTRVEHDARVENLRAAGSVEVLYQNSFKCVPLTTLPYRPPRRTRKPVVEGPQTAVVVGSGSAEILTDKYARVKVQFFWDRQGANDANSSCWIRVGQAWAGQGWGAIHIPRIGHEVIVAFLEGDPDQPIIVGGVYNAANMPPYTLPDNMTQSGIRSRSTLEGGVENYNELRFEDKKGSELITFHAERDFERVVENNDSLVVGSDQAPVGSQTISVYKDRTETVETGNETVTVKKGNRVVNIDTGNETLNVKTGNREVNVNTGNDTHNVKTGNRVVNVDTGNDTHNVKTGNREATISVGNEKLTISIGDQTTTLNLGQSTTKAMIAITLQVGASSIKIDNTGVTINGPMIKLNGTAMIQASAPMTEVSGEGMLELSGGIVIIG